MHILIVGGRGQLGRALQSTFQQSATEQISSWSRPGQDIADPVIADKIEELGPDVVINAAAWTNVDGAESDPNGTYAANALGPQYLADGCRRIDATLVHVSTNEVFAGHTGHYYREYDLPLPNSTYSRSKLAGERAVCQLLDRCYIVRVAWQFGPGGNNFPSKIIAAAEKHGALKVVADEVGNPTFAPDVATSIAKLIETERYGTYHLVNDGQSSRFEFAKAALELSGLGNVPLTPISSSEWPRPAPPPLHAVLVNQAAAALGIKMRHWREALEEYLAG